MFRTVAGLHAAEGEDLTARSLPRGARRQAALVAAADRAAGAADAVIRHAWRQLLGVLKVHSDPWAARNNALMILGRLRGELQLAVLPALVRAGRQAHAADAAELARLPLKYLRRAAPRRRLPLFEDEGDPPLPRPEWEDATRDDLAAILFPTPSEATILRLLSAGPEPWLAQLARATRLADPHTLATIIGTGYALGKSQREIARDLLPAVNGVRVSARRIARTEGVRIGHALQMHAHEQLGDLVIGYTLRKSIVPDSRPWHVARDGAAYWRQPGPGQKGFLQMPHPPEEPRDPRERPPGTPQTAYNCLCYLVPILRPI